MTVVSGDAHDSRYAVENLLIHEDMDLRGEGGVTNFWLVTANRKQTGSKPTFILNLGCRNTFSEIQLVNTHNGHFKNGATKQFK